MNRIPIAALIVLSLAAFATAEPVINVGCHYLAPGLAGQVVELYVTGGDEVEGLEFVVQIGGGTSGLLIQDVDILTGTIFAGNKLYPGSYIEPRYAYQGTLTPAETSVVADGLLATLTLDATGLTDGQYLLSLTDTPEGRTSFAGLPASISDGQIVIAVAGDADTNGTVDDLDLAAMLSNWDQNGRTWGDGDFTGEGAVNDIDLALLLNSWGTSLPLEVVPEPVALTLLSLGAAVGLLRRRTAA